MQSAGLRSAASRARAVDDHAQKRKSPDAQDSNESSQKKPKSGGTTLLVGPLALPAGQSPISTNNRGALCDSVPYWKAHQGGIQSKQRVATGMLLNGKTTPRDILQSQVIITTVGGGFATTPDGQRLRTDDQDDKCTNHVVLKNAMEIGQPIGIVIGKKPVEKGVYANNLLRVQLDYHYNVLDWFFVTDIWSELQPTQRDGSKFVQFVVRLQKIDLTSTSWWMPRGAERDDMYAVGQFHCRTETCQFCNTPSKEIFKEGWCCLTKTCVEFFHFPNLSVDLDTLQYNQNFLNERAEWTAEQPVENLVPGLPILPPDMLGSEAVFKGGIVCPTCKTPTRRIFWGGWECEKACGFELWMPPKDITLEQIHLETQLAFRRRTKFFESDDRLDTAYHYNIPGYEATTFYLPNIPQDVAQARYIGSVTVFRPTQSTLEREGGLNDLFQEVQEATRTGQIELRRHPAFCRGSHLEELTSHFSCNMGADYKFGVVVETSNGFETAPAPVLKALSRLTWGGATAVALASDHAASDRLSVDSQSMPDNFIDFNEQLMLGYFEGSQISFHDDGEKELGPTVATLSLGSPSIMRFRAKKKSGFEGLGKTRTMLSFVLEHGDIVVMHGTKIHKYYEHAVTAAGVRRYALTCRYIRPDMIEDPERREKAIANGKVPEYWQKQAYTGEPA
ncbi:hypothetical protein GGR55DRAFT_696551 [Xylaria sp. FL0064]|nr:hypothetical protein GGR55DRAFT_696551 [Xylaria sp. FL0064]